MRPSVLNSAAKINWYRYGTKLLRCQLSLMCSSHRFCSLDFRPAPLLFPLHRMTPTGRGRWGQCPRSHCRRVSSVHRPVPCSLAGTTNIKILKQWVTSGPHIIVRRQVRSDAAWRRPDGSAPVISTSYRRHRGGSRVTSHSPGAVAYFMYVIIMHVT